MCPVCQRIYSREDLDASPPKISLAHAPPRAVGGKLTTLACTECDTRIGAECDRQVKYEKDALGDFDNKTVKKATFVSAKGTRRDVEMKIDGNEISMYNRPGMPAEQFQKNWRQISREYGSVTPIEFSIETQEPKVELDKWLLSNLYSAFLVMFYYFGYEYILNPNVTVIRQILNNEASSLNYKNAVISVHRKSPHQLVSLPIVSILTDPKDQQCFLIEIPSPHKADISRIISLPGFGEIAKKTYENLMDLPMTTPLQFTVIPISFGKPGERFLDPNFKDFGYHFWKKVIKCD